MLFGIPNDLFDRWSKRGSTKYNSSLLIAALALCWSLWITRNEIVFYKRKPKSFFAVIVLRNLLAPPVGAATMVE